MGEVQVGVIYNTLLDSNEGDLMDLMVTVVAGRNESGN